MQSKPGEVLFGLLAYNGLKLVILNSFKVHSIEPKNAFERPSILNVGYSIQTELTKKCEGLTENSSLSI